MFAVIENLNFALELIFEFVMSDLVFGEDFHGVVIFGVFGADVVDFPESSSADQSDELEFVSSKRCRASVLEF